jgi:hypothetical protein
LRSRRQSRLPLDRTNADHVGMLLFASAITAFGLFEVLAYRYGADTRPGFDERPERGPRNAL